MPNKTSPDSPAAKAVLEREGESGSRVRKAWQRAQKRNVPSVEKTDTRRPAAPAPVEGPSALTSTFED